MWKQTFVVFQLAITFYYGVLPVCGNKSFIIDYENDQFLMDGKPFRYISGSMHYFRVPHEYWKDRFEKMKAAGLNAVQTYIEWSQHEPEPGIYNFHGNLDFVSYINLAYESGLYVIIRAGPYICAERDMGGLPYWLLRENPKMTLRTSDPSYIYYVDRWMAKLLPMIKQLLYVNGGPVITVQVENEYGSYYACDWNYMSHLRDLFRNHLGNEVVLFTTDGNSDHFLKCGKIQGLYATVDFGPDENVSQSFHAQRNHEPNGPLVNSEYYTYGHTNWGFSPPVCDYDKIIQKLEEMLNLNASINMYMFHGGTSFGFTSGANLIDTYIADTTTYDFGAPLTESGQYTDLYFKIRESLKKYNTSPLPPVPDPTPRSGYGNVTMKHIGSIFDLLPYLSSSPSTKLENPLTFEALGQAYGFVLYETVICEDVMDPSLLSVPGISDRGYIFLDHVPVGVLSRTGHMNDLPITAKPNQTLSLLVENQGRINYGMEMKDFKGLLYSPTIAGIPLKNWTMTSLPFNSTRLLKILSSMKQYHHAFSKGKWSMIGIPSLYSGHFVLPQNLSEPQDTFLLPSHWTKGVAFINGFNLGRYWPAMGPQVTLYIPKGLLKTYPNLNYLLLFEQQRAPCLPVKQNDTCVVDLIDQEILNGFTPNK